MAVIDLALPRLKRKPCGAAILGFYGRVPPAQVPRAITQADAIAGNLSYRRIRISGDEATIRFPDGGTWDLRRAGRRWLITRLPILPKGFLGAGGATAPRLA